MTMRTRRRHSKGRLHEFSRPRLTRLDDRIVPAIVTWDGGAGTTNWTDAANWSGNVLPGLDDDVTIDVPATTITVTVPNNIVISIRSLNSQEHMAILGGTSLTLGGLGTTSEANGSFSILGATLTSLSNFNANGPTTIDGASLIAQGGGSIAMPNATSDAAPVGSIFRASGAGSVLDLRNLTQVTTSSSLEIQALGGGHVDLRALVSATDDGPFGGRAVYFTAGGTGSLIDLPAFTTLVDQNAGQGTSTLRAENGGEVRAPLLTSLANSAIYLDATGVLPVAQYTSITNTYVRLTGGSRAFGALTNGSRSYFEVNGAITAFPVLSNIDGATLLVSGGVTLAVLQATTDVAPIGSIFRASGAGSVLDLRNLAGALISSSFEIQALGGGRVDLSSLEAVVDDGPFGGRAAYFTAGGTGSLIDLPAFTTLVDQNAGQGTSTLRAENGGEVRAPLLTSLANSAIYLDATGVLPIAQYTSMTNTYVRLTGGTRTFGVLTNGSRSYFEVNGAITAFPVLSNIDGATLLVTGGVTLAVLQATTDVAPIGSTFRASGAGSVLDLRNLTQVTTSSSLEIQALGGGYVDLRGLVSASDDGPFGGRAVYFFADNQTSGVGTIELSSFRTLTDQNSGQGQSSLTAAGGLINLPGMGTTTVANTIVSATQGGIISGSLLNLGNGSALEGNSLGASLTGIGEIRPVGSSVGNLTIDGNLALSSAAIVRANISGPVVGLYDRIVVNGTVSLAGALLTLSTGYPPTNGTNFTIVANDGSDPVVGTFAALPEGATIVANGSTFRISYVGGSNNNDVVLTVVATAPPRINLAPVNSGAIQRSSVTNASVWFNTPVTFAGATNAAFTLTRNSDGAVVNFNAAVSTNGNFTIVTLSNFSGPATSGGSLTDGRYTLTALASQISAGGMALDGNGDGTAGDNYIQSLFRFYGDMNGDARVDISDFGFFSLAYLTPANYNAALDFNNDGRIDIADFGQFSVRYFTSLP